MYPHLSKLKYGTEITPLIDKRAEIITTKEELTINLIFPDNSFPQEYPCQEEYLIPLESIRKMISKNNGELINE